MLSQFSVKRSHASNADMSQQLCAHVSVVSKLQLWLVVQDAGTNGLQSRWAWECLGFADFFPVSFSFYE